MTFLYFFIIIDFPDKLRDMYRHKYQMHNIHGIDKHGNIVLKEARIDEFAVKIKVSHDARHRDSFRDETRQYLRNLKGFTSDEIEIPHMIHENHRVTFIRGIAGMGKSVLAKQLTYGWSNREMYAQFKLCIMFECRNINAFVSNEGKKLEKYRTIEEFLRLKFNYDLGDGEGVLFIVDGLDELFDITEDYSIIGQLLNLSDSKYSGSKIIVTGRPHIESKLEGYGIEVGGLWKLEIQGLSSKQIETYVEKFASCTGDLSAICKTVYSSKSLPIVHVPQFLNTICCIAILRKGEVINGPIELYCWTIYFLLKQHVDKSNSVKKIISQVFKEYSELLKALGKVCHELLTKNKIILNRSIHSLLGENERGSEFIQSLFVDVSDDIDQKYQFKHLSLMEFLSALHVCGVKDLMEIVKSSLEKEWIEVVLFVCGFIAGYSSQGIIKEILTNATDFRGIDAKSFLENVMDIVRGCKWDERTRFEISIQIMVLFLNENFKETEFITKIISQLHFELFDSAMIELHCEEFYSDAINSRNIMAICSHLERICECDEDSIRAAFDNVNFSWVIEADSFKILDCVKYLGSVSRVVLRYIKASSSKVQEELEEKVLSKFTKIGIVDCEIIDEITYSRERLSGDALRWLWIERCSLNLHSFSSMCDWGMAYGLFTLRTLDITEQWWEALVKRIEEKKSNGCLKTWSLEICNCSTNITVEMKRRVSKPNYKKLLILS